MSLVNQFLENLLEVASILEMNYILLILLWVLILFLEVVWSGLAKAIKLLIFPGVILHIGTILLLFYKGRRVGVYWVLRTYYTKTSLLLRIKSPRDALKILVANFIVAIVGSFLIFQLSYFVSGTLARLLLIWLGVSVFIANFPRSADLEVLLYTLWSNEPISAISIFLSLLILTLGIELFSLTNSVVLTVIYLMIIFALTPFDQTQYNRFGEFEEPLVLDEEI